MNLISELPPVWAALAAAAERLDGAGVPWVLGGSAGLALRGLPLASAPRDIDLYVDSPDAAGAHAALAGYAVDKPTFSETDRYRSTLSHYAIAGVRIELVAGFEVSSGEGWYHTRVREALLPAAARLEAGGRRIPVVPLAHELWFNALREREDRVALVADAIAAAPSLHEAGLAAVARCGRLEPALAQAIEAKLGRQAGSIESGGNE